MTRIHVVAGGSKHKTTFRNKRGQTARSITASEYLSVVLDTFLPQGTAMFSTQGLGSWVLQQDNDPCHRFAADAIKEWNLKRGSSISLLPSWPPNSPDLSPIENLWGYVGARVQARGPTSFEAFKQAIIHEQGNVPRNVLHNLYNSMPRRIAQVIELEGDKTKY